MNREEREKEEKKSSIFDFIWAILLIILIILFCNWWYNKYQSIRIAAVEQHIEPRGTWW